MKAFQGTAASCFFVVVIVVAVLLVGHTDAFADYLLGGGGCWTELSPDEVIMNHAVTEAIHVEGPNLRLVVHGHENASNGSDHHKQVVLSSFPQTVTVEVVGGEHLKQYQYVIDVFEAENEDTSEGEPKNKKKGEGSPLAAFEGGKCTDQRRVAGHAKDGPRTLVVHGAGAHIVAGWAAGHEAVKLTPSVSFVLAETKQGGDGRDGGPIKSGGDTSEAKHPLEKVDTEPEEWVSALIDGCPEVVEARQVGTFPIVHSPVKLQASKAEHENQVQLTWPGDSALLLPAQTSRKLVLVSSSSDAGFEGGACGGLTATEHSGPRAVVVSNPGSHEIDIPVLTIHKPHTVTVYAYAFDATTRSIQRTDPFVLRWVPDKPPPVDVHAHDADPQKLVDAKVRTDPHQLHQQALAYQGKDRGAAADHTGSGSEKFPVRADDRDPTSPDERRHRHNHHLSQEESVVDDDAASLDQHPGHRKDGVGAALHDILPKHRGDGAEEDKDLLPRRGFHHALHLHRGATGGAGPSSRSSSRFTVTSSYYAGVAILVVMPIAVVHICLRASRKAKGRRTL